VSRFDGTGPRTLLAIFLATLTFAATVPSQSANSTNQQARKRMARAVERTVDEGLQGKLPPHISTLLGLTKETECPVMQGVLRTGKVVQGFDVSIANKNDVVLFVVDEATGDQTLYLTSKDGLLRKLIKVDKGEGQVKKITPEDRKAFEREKQFWLDRLAPAPVAP